jgi:hypothetical protein
MVGGTLKMIGRAAVLAVLLAATSMCDKPQEPSAWTFGPSGFDGGGVQSVVAVSPFDSQIVLSGGDTSGIQKSTDGGAGFRLSNAGLDQKLYLNTAAIRFSKNRPGVIYLASGHTNGGGLFESTDNGDTWRLFGSALFFEGGNTDNVAALPAPMPRQTGNLIAIDDSRSDDYYVYAGTFKDGLKRRHFHAGQWGDWESVSIPAATQAPYIRSIALNPDNPDQLFVSLYGDGVYESNDARAVTPSWTKVPGGSPYMEELVFLGEMKKDGPYGGLYAGGTDKPAPRRGGSWPEDAWGKIWEFNTADSAWVEIHSTDRTEVDGEMFRYRADYMALDGYRDPGTNKDVLLAGTFDLGRDDADKVVLKRHYDIKAAAYIWSAVAGGSHVSDVVEGSGADWWLSVAEPRTMLGGPQSKVTFLEADPGNDGRFYTAGNQGLWRTDDNGEHWSPRVRNINTTFNRNVRVDPHGSNRVYVTDADWAFVASADRMANVKETKPQVDNGMALALDAGTPADAPSGVYVSIGNQSDNVLGEVWYSPDPTAEEPDWQSTGYKEAICQAIYPKGAPNKCGPRVLGLSVGRQDGQPTIIAAAEEQGIWRRSFDMKDGSYTWKKVSGDLPVMKAQSTKTASLAWPQATNEVYLYDRDSGIWRSMDAGETWSQLWAHKNTANSAAKKAEDMSGHVAAYADPKSGKTTLYVSTATGLFRIDDAGGAKPTEAVSLGFGDSGPIQVDAKGVLYVAKLIMPGAKAGLYTSGDRGKTFVKISDSFYDENAGYPFDLDVSADGENVYVGTNGQGVIVGTKR